MTNRASYLSLGILMAVFLTGLFSGDVYAQEEHVPPFIGVSTGSNVNVRAGQSANYERLCQLALGEEVYVTAKEFSWYKIQLPPTAKSYVSKRYVQYLGQNAGGVAAADVNIRAGAGVHYSVIGQLTKGEQIYILEELDEWYRIEPVADSFGWVTEEYIDFKSKNLNRFPLPPPRKFYEEDIVREKAAAKPAVKKTKDSKVVPAGPKPSKEVVIRSRKIDLTPDREELTPKHLPAVFDIKTAASKPVSDTPKYKPNQILSFVGYVKKHRDTRSDGIHFEIVADGQTVCYIQGVNHMLDRFVDQQVKVEGTVNTGLLSQYPRPVIVLVKVRLII